PLCRGCAEHFSLPYLRSNASNFRDSSRAFEPDRICVLLHGLICVRPPVVLATSPSRINATEFVSVTTRLVRRPGGHCCYACAKAVSVRRGRRVRLRTFHTAA